TADPGARGGAQRPPMTGGHVFGVDLRRRFDGTVVVLPGQEGVAELIAGEDSRVGLHVAAVGQKFEQLRRARRGAVGDVAGDAGDRAVLGAPAVVGEVDRKSTRLNSSHVSISYAVFCLN